MPVTPTNWGDIVFKAVVVVAVTGGAILDWDTNINVARTDAMVVGHMTNHPDAGLTLRLDRMQARMDRQAEQIRELERELRLKREQD